MKPLTFLIALCPLFFFNPGGVPSPLLMHLFSCSVLQATKKVQSNFACSMKDRKGKKKEEIKENHPPKKKGNAKGKRQRRRTDIYTCVYSESGSRTCWAMGQLRSTVLEREMHENETKSQRAEWQNKCSRSWSAVPSCGSWKKN